ncbi:MAG: hypothetical protein J6S97_00890 [Bacteroidales bacterium]|nr:hypothetical protein [Bacteroidales bacterium]
MKKALAIFGAVLLLLSSCATDSPKSHPKVLSHRGLRTSGTEFVTDENTLDALRRAQEAKVDGCEFDVHMSADGQLLIRHDAKIDATLNMQKSTAEEIRAYRLPFGNQIPTLHEWLQQAKTTPEILQFIEIKAHATQEIENVVVAKCLEEVKQLDMLDQVYFLSFKAATCEEVLRLEPQAKVLLNSSSLHNSLPPEEVEKLHINAVSYSVEVFLNHPEWVAEFKQKGIETFFWMVNSLYLRNIAEKLGVDWVTTDFYDIIGY